VYIPKDTSNQYGINGEILSILENEMIKLEGKLINPLGIMMPAPRYLISSPNGSCENIVKPRIGLNIITPAHKSVKKTAISLEKMVDFSFNNVKKDKNVPIMVMKSIYVSGKLIWM